MFTTQIDTSYLVGLIVMGVLVVGTIFGLPPLLRWFSVWGDISSKPMPRKWAYGISSVLAAIMLLIFVVAAWPVLPGEYNSFTPFSGIVKETSSRFLASDTQGGGSNQRFLVEFTNGQHVGCDDTRCSGLKSGDPVTLLCEKVFQWNATEGWACNFGKYGLNK